jgi:hypothetical protein
MNSGLIKTLQRIVLAIALAASFFIILTYLLSLGLGVLIFFSTAEGLEFSREPIVLHPLLILDIKVIINAGLYFLFLWWVFTFCFVAAWKYRESLSNKIREFFSGSSEQSPFRNNLLAMPLIASMLLVAIVVLHLLQTQSGIPTGEPDVTDPFSDFLRFSSAPLVEEIVFRIIPIGVFLMTYIFLAGKALKPDFSWRKRLKTCILSVLQPEKAKEEIGLKTISRKGLFEGLIWAEWVMIFFTAFLFGVAHYLGGWGPGKISQAALSGAIFALAYLYYGIQAPILLHWYFNYYFYVFDLSVDYFSAEINLYSFSWSINILLGILMWIIMPIFGILALLRRNPKITSIPESLI